jgi:superfamily II DNA or RNA helicase
MSDLQVGYDQKANKFVILCPFWANDALADMPTRRWDARHRCWRAPVVRANAEYIRDRLASLATVTPDAAAAIVRATAPAPRPTGFPSWYQFKTKPRQSQMDCLNKLWGLDAGAMFAWMGRGKTKSTIDLACAYRMNGDITAMLVVCKLSLRKTWVNQWALHAPLAADIFLPPDPSIERLNRWLARPHDFKILVVGTESLSAGRMIEVAEAFANAHVKLLMVVDESTMIAGHKAQRAKNCVTLGRHAAKRLALTGTPISDGPLNVFMQFEYLDPNIIGIGDYYAFRNRYAVMGGYRDPRTRKPLQVVGYQNLDELTKLIAPYTYQIGKDPELPPKVYKKVYVQLTPAQKALYRSAKNAGGFMIKDQEVILKNALEVALRLSQITGGHAVTVEEKRRVDGKIRRESTPVWVMPWAENPKIKEMLDIVREMPGRQMLIWTPFLPEMKDAVAALNDQDAGRVAAYSGAADEAERDALERDFQAGKIRYLVINQQTGSMGLTLTNAEVVIYLNNTDKLIDRQQSEDRCHRDGLDHSVLYIDILAEGTVDEHKLTALENKQNVAQYFHANLDRIQQLLDLNVLDSPTQGVV